MPHDYPAVMISHVANFDRNGGVPTSNSLIARRRRLHYAAASSNAVNLIWSAALPRIRLEAPAPRGCLLEMGTSA